MDVMTMVAAVTFGLMLLLLAVVVGVRLIRATRSEAEDWTPPAPSILEPELLAEPA